MENLRTEPKEKPEQFEELISRQARYVRLGGQLRDEDYIAARQVKLYMAFEDSIGIYLR